jgi:hypothetical protein
MSTLKSGERIGASSTKSALNELSFTSLRPCTQGDISAATLSEKEAKNKDALSIASPTHPTPPNINTTHLS